ncbi:hypothetical protein Salat_0412500 [Sesamum alatum]|uniref:Uncharacterized protein n=1 Tax=Sesamum alatum TaxID=300844 RepID=A0AAE1Z3I0_9LAMI|nr:hypothetical protein Salat_0412500 [Sesamum alatum]
MVAQEVASGDKGAPVQDQAQDKGAVAPASPAPSTAAAKPSNVVVPSLPMFDVPSTSSTRGPRKSQASRVPRYEQPSVAGKFPKSVELAAQRVASGDKGAPVRDQAQDHGAVASASLAPTSPAAQPLIVVVPSLPVPNAPSASATPKDTEPPISPVVHHHHHRPQWKHQHSRLLHHHHPKQKGQRANPFMSRPTCLGKYIYGFVPGSLTVVFQWRSEIPGLVPSKNSTAGMPHVPRK